MVIKSLNCKSLICLSLVFSLVTISFAQESCYSELWGSNGQNWSSQSRLPDFSFAGYQCGEKPIPCFEVSANVRDFGAKGDGVTDDTKAFNQAIRQTTNGAILIPAGTYLITDFIVIDKSDIVLRGQGPEKTVLWFPKNLTEVKPDWGATTTGKRTSNYSWGGGYITFQGKYNQTKLADINNLTKRGGSILSVSSVKNIAVGQWVCIRLQDDKAKTLTEWLYSSDPGDISLIKAFYTSQASRVTKIDPVNGTITIDRPLRIETKKNWKPVLLSFDPTVTNSGVENLSCKFPPTPWNGEFSELGYNGIDMRSVAHCWARNIRLINAEGGIFVRGIHCTLSDIYLSANKPAVYKYNYKAKEPCHGHHGISVTGSDNLITNFNIDMCYVHDLSVTSTAAGNVFSQGSGNDLCFDHHKRAPHANLFTQIDCGQGSRIWRHGGGDKLGKPSGGWTTFWNITAAQYLPCPPNEFGPWSMNIVGLKTQDVTSKTIDGKWFEAISPETLIPQNLYNVQLSRRLSLNPCHKPK